MGIVGSLSLLCSSVRRLTCQRLIGLTDYLELESKLRKKTVFS